MSWAIDEADVIEPERLAESAIDDLIAEDTSIREGKKQPENRRRLTVAEKFAVIQFEAQVICVAASNIRQGIELTAEDVERCWVAKARIEYLLEADR